ncbi:Fe-S oxidoreductase [Pedobacter sp. CG_S7]|uniref:hypothetical protein n=1 Tax=Pedobacter sp. CG_S7 TaxID=3143930 RepID=UPI0033941F9B
MLDLYISCKGCKTECPSGVDVAKMKAEYQQQDYDQNGISFRVRLIAGFSGQMKLASVFPAVYNFIFNKPVFRKILNKLIGFHPERIMPSLGSITLLKWFKQRKYSITSDKKVYFFCDELTNYNDVEIGKKAIKLLNALGYEVIVPKHLESGRTYLSKGLLRKAKRLPIQTLTCFQN